MMPGMQHDGIRERYFLWLYRQNFHDLGPDGPHYTGVCAMMHAIEFNDRVPNDDNRSRDGIQLREEFISGLDYIDLESLAVMHDMGQASLLEVLTALSRRADYIVEKGAPEWFRIFLQNLGLFSYPDDVLTPANDRLVERALRTFNERTYSRNGRGGIFPLIRAEEDQRATELWYQMAAYMKDKHMY
jgi:hypothetical protein